MGVAVVYQNNWVEAVLTQIDKSEEQYHQTDLITDDYALAVIKGQLAVTSYWRPLEGTDPYIGKAGEISCEPEIKAEVTVFKEKVDETIEAIKKVHPYEEPVINVIPIWRTSF